VRGDIIEDMPLLTELGKFAADMILQRCRAYGPAAYAASVCSYCSFRLGAGVHRRRAVAKAAETRQTTPANAANIMHQPVTTANQPGTSPPAPRNAVAVTKNAIAKNDAT